MDLSACGAASDINPHQYSDKLASGKKKKLKDVTTSFSNRKGNKSDTDGIEQEVQ